jgi:hypothetical protein
MRTKIGAGIGVGVGLVLAWGTFFTGIAMRSGRHDLLPFGADWNDTGTALAVFGFSILLATVWLAWHSIKAVQTKRASDSSLTRAESPPVPPTRP